MSDAVNTEQLEGRYVTCEDCMRMMHEQDKRIDAHDKEIAMLKIQMKINNWLSLAIAGGIVALVIKVYAGG